MPAVRVIGKVASLWRYPVKSMRGEALETAFVGHGGIRGDRTFALRDPAGQPAFPWVTAREQPALLLHRPRLRHAAHGSASGSAVVDIETSAGEVLAVDDERLLQRLAVSGRVPTVERSGRALDASRFRSNVLLDLEPAAGFAEDRFVGRTLRIGESVRIAVLERDARCRMIGLDPETGAEDGSVLRHVVRHHDGCVGVYAEALNEGTIRPGDVVVLPDGQADPA